MPSNVHKKDQAYLCRVIGERMKIARDLNNLSQKDAAKRLGYVNSSRLSKIERAVDTVNITLPIIAKASEVYDVSIDYLFGFNDDWEIDARKIQERLVSSWLLKHFDESYKRTMETLRKLNDRLEAINNIVHLNYDDIMEFDRLFAEFRRKNPQFDDEAVLGAKLLFKLEEMKSNAIHGKNTTKKLKMECENSAHPVSKQLDLDFS